MTTIYVFAREGYEPDAYLVRASTEQEAKGKMYDRTPTGIQPDLKGSVEEVLSNDDVEKIA